MERQSERWACSAHGVSHVFRCGLGTERCGFGVGVRALSDRSTQMRPEGSDPNSEGSGVSHQYRRTCTGTCRAVFTHLGRSKSVLLSAVLSGWMLGESSSWMPRKRPSVKETTSVNLLSFMCSFIPSAFLWDKDCPLDESDLIFEPPPIWKVRFFRDDFMGGERSADSTAGGLWGAFGSIGSSSAVGLEWGSCRRPNKVEDHPLGGYDQCVTGKSQELTQLCASANEPGNLISHISNILRILRNSIPTPPETPSNCCPFPQDDHCPPEVSTCLQSSGSFMSHVSPAHHSS